MNQIIDKKFFSSTDLKKHTKNVLDTTENLWEVFIMNNNKPKVIIMSVKKYNQMNKNSIPEVEPDEWEKQSIAQYEKDLNDGKLEFLEWKEVFEYLEALK